MCYTGKYENLPHGVGKDATYGKEKQKATNEEKAKHMLKHSILI